MTVIEVLDIIDAKLREDTYESKQLWLILSALRGPDTGDDALKNATTSVIRSAAFPKTAGLSDTMTGVHGALYRQTDIKEVSETLPGHFGSHVRFAKEVLLKLGRNPYRS